MKTQLIRRRPTLSAEYIVTGMKRHKYATLTAIVLIVASGIGLSVYKYNGATPPSSQQNLAAINQNGINDSTTERDLKFSKLPISGQVDSIVISPDGKYVAYMPSGDGVRLLDLATSVDTELSSEGYNWAPSFSPDSKFVYYSYSTEAPVTIEFRKLSINGGSSIKVPANPDSFSPDGSTMVFTRDVPGGQAVMLANSDDSNERMIAKIAPENRIANRLVFSPDGKTLAGQLRFKDENGPFMRLVGFSVTDGKQRVLSDKKWDFMMGVVWLPSGNLVAVARENYSDPSQLWSIPPGGEPRAITSGLVSYQGLSATSKGDVLLTRQLSGSNVDSSDLWILPENDPRKIKRITTSGELQGRFTWSPDGRIIICSDVSGNRDIWIMNADGGGRKQLTSDPGGDAQPTVSPDGKFIAFTSNRANGVDQIFRMDIHGGNVKQLTQGKQKVLASFSPDGKWVYFVEIPSKTIQRVPADGGESTVITTAPDGWDLAGIDVNKVDVRLAYGLSRFAKGWENKLGILPTKGEGKLIDVPATFDVGRPRWAPDGRTIDVLSKETRDIWSLPVDGKGKPRQVTDFKTPGTRGFSWTADGKHLLVGRQTLMINPVLIRNSGN